MLIIGKLAPSYNQGRQSAYVSAITAALVYRFCQSPVKPIKQGYSSSSLSNTHDIHQAAKLAKELSVALFQTVVNPRPTY
jgi:hypothetical protein